VPYFESDPDIDERSEPLFDALMDAMLELGMSSEREVILIKMGAHRDRALAVGALARLASMHGDLGNFEDAWQAFREAQRRSPDDPQLAHLEILLLNSEGREDEARLRAPMIAARLRKLSPEHAGLADVVEELAKGGRNFRSEYESDYEPEEIGAWVALGNVARAQKIDAADCQRLYKLSESRDESTTKNTRIVETGGTLRSVETQWDRKFPVEPPFSTQSIGNVDAVLDDLPKVASFLHANPRAWSSIHVLDVLLQTGIALVEETHSSGVLEAANEMAAHAVKLVRVLLEKDLDQPTPWVAAPNRPLLRLVSNAAILADKKNDKKTFVALTEWMLRLNSNDNHGSRAMLVTHRLNQADALGALEILDQYPHDFPSSEFQRTLALFMLDRRDEAATQWVVAVQGSAHIAKAILTERASQPSENMSHGIAVGGEWEAHDYRREMRSVWKRTGAIAWAAALPPVKAKTVVRKTSAAKKTAAKKRGDKTGVANAAEPEIASARPLAEVLADAYAHLPNAARMVGLLTGAVWSPNRNPSTQWINLAMEWLTADGEPDDLQVTLNRLIGLYNGLNEEVLNGHREAALPGSVLRLLEKEDETLLDSWVAGFVTGCQSSAQSWQAAGVSVSAKKAPFATLYALAARAPLARRGTSPIRDDEGQPLLVGLDAPPPPAIGVMQMALMPLWEIARRRAIA
jgi:tetratricopeptide (TPR) repeat protein